MNKPIFEVDIKGIKCDACDYTDDDAKLEDFEQYLNVPCPKCGAILLTQADMDTVNNFVALQEALEGFTSKGPIGRSEVGMKGDGTVDIGDWKIVDE